MMKVCTGCVTNRGNYRRKNQDRAVCHVKNDKDFVFVSACVCDGIGCFEQSEIAAEMVTDGITRWFNGVKKFFPDFIDEETLLEDLEITIRELNELVYAYRKDGGVDIGCTMSLLLLVDRNYHVFHVGDSRIYIVGKNNFFQLTHDEVSMIESHGEIKPFLANYIGKSKELWMNKLSGTIGHKEWFLLGTDGLFKLLTFEDIKKASQDIRKSFQAQEVCEQFLKLVLKRGEKDNVSCILVYLT